MTDYIKNKPDESSSVKKRKKRASQEGENSRNPSGLQERQRRANQEGENSRKNSGLQERQRRASQEARKRSQEDAERMRRMKEEAEENARLRKEKQQAAAKRRKIQLWIRLVLTVFGVAAVIVGIVMASDALQKKKQESDGGAGTNILQAAENTGSTETNQDPAKEEAGAANAAADPASTPEGGSNQLTICMVGNAIVDQRILEASATESGYDFNNLYENVAQGIKQYDLKILSHESMIGGSILGVSGSPLYNTPFEEADAIAKAGFNMVLHATDHALDKGQAGIRNCLGYWHSAYPEMAVLGIHDPGDDTTADNVYVFEKNGIRVAVLNYTFKTNLEPDELLEERDVPTDLSTDGTDTGSDEKTDEKFVAVNILDQDILRNDVARAKEVSDFVIVCPHWGDESKSVATKEQEEWISLMMSLGVDLVIGTHPHMPQSVDLYKGNSGHTMLVYNSLGNFFSNQNEKEENVGGMAQIILKKDASGRVEIADYGIRGLVCHESRDGEAFSTYFLEDYTEDLADSNDVMATDPEFSYSFCWEWREEIFGNVKTLNG